MEILLQSAINFASNKNQTIKNLWENTLYRILRNIYEVTPIYFNGYFEKAIRIH